MKAAFDYRLKITDALGNVTFFVRRKGDTTYMSGSETPLAFCNLLSGDAAETRFALEDACNGQDAAKALRAVFTRRWKDNTRGMPKVEVLS